jgi:ABC-type dipeptide/oligopeptide/nickel transport system permease subunit
MGPWRQGWSRLRRDRLTMVALVVLSVILLAGLFGGAVVTRLVHHNGVDPYPYASNGNLRPVGPWTRVPALREAKTDDYGQLASAPRGARETLFPLGADGPLGRDELIRLLDGIRTSLEIAIGGVFFALLIGLPFGMIAGYFGGFADTVVSQFTETVMAFPLLLFLVFASAHLSPALRHVHWSWVLPPGVFGEALLIGAFTAFYPARLARARMLTLRREEFVEASTMVGASHRRIIFGHLLPHLAPTILVWGAVAAGTNILLEVGLSFIGVGVQPQIPTLGQLLSTTWGTVQQPRVYNGTAYTPWQTIFPTVVILITVVSLNQLSEGARRALDPRGTA